MTTVWQGVLEWADESDNRQVPVPFQLSACSQDGEPELKVDSWPLKLFMNLIPKKLTNIVEAYIKNCKSVQFHPPLQPCKALKSLTKKMSSGYAGYVQFPDLVMPPRDINMLILLYSAEKGTYEGFIPNDQGVHSFSGFVDLLWRMTYDEKTSQPKSRQDNKEDQLPYEELKQIINSLRKTLRCVVCRITLKEDVLTCTNGHCICKSCRGSQRKCPTCRKNFSNVEQNTLVRQVLNIVPKKCQHDDCWYLIRYGDDHETYCTYRSTECKFCSNAMVPVKDLMLHIKENHSLCQDTSGSFRLQVPTDQETSSFIIFQSVFGHLLWVEIEINFRTRVLKSQFFPVNHGKPIDEPVDLLVKLACQNKYEVQRKIIMLNEDQIKDENCLLVPISEIQWCEETTAPPTSNFKIGTLNYSFTRANASQRNSEAPPMQALANDNKPGPSK